MFHVVATKGPVHPHGYRSDSYNVVSPFAGEDWQQNARPCTSQGRRLLSACAQGEITRDHGLSSALRDSVILVKNSRNCVLECVGK